MSTTKSGMMIAFISLTLMIWTGCEDYNLPRLDSPALQIESIREDGLFLEVTSRIEGVERQTVRRYGHLWSRSADSLSLELYDGIDSRESLTPNETPASFSARILRTTLLPNTAYFLRAFAVTDQRVCYSEPVLYANLNVQVQTGDILYSGGNQAQAKGEIRISQTGIRLLAYGHCWTAEPRVPVLGQDRCSRFDGQLAARIPFSSELPDLQNGSTYTIRAYAMIEADQGGGVTLYGEPVTYRAELNNFWSPLAIAGGPSAREGATTFTLGSSAYLAGGIRYDSLARVTVFDDCWRFSPAGGWQACRPLPVPMAYSVAFTLGERAYLGAGFQLTATGGRDSVVVSGRFFTYDPAADQWQEIAPLPAAMAYGLAFTHEGKGYVGLGVGNDEIWQYGGPAEDSWSVHPPAFPGESNSDLVAFTLGENAYVGGGESRRFWRFRGAEGWEAAPAFPGPTRALAVAVSSAQGKGYYALGLDEASNVLRDVWTFDPAQSDPDLIWQPLPELPAAGRIFASGFVLDGRLYLGLGSASTVQPRGDFWVFSQ